MSCNVNVTGLSKATEAVPGSFFVVETDSGTQILDFKNLSLGLDNVTFASTISANAANIASNYSLLQQLSGSITTVIQGQILGVQWKGEWNSSSTYIKSDAVYYTPTSGSYIADMDVPAGITPTTNTYWDLIALNVDEQLPLSNKGDLLTHDGVNDLVALSAGEAGSFLKSQGSGNTLTWQKSPGGRAGSTCKKLSTGLTAGNSYWPGEVLLYHMDNNTIKSVGRAQKYGTAYGVLSPNNGQLYNIPQVAGIDKYFDRAVDVIKDVYQVGSEVTFFITEAGGVWGVGRNDGTPGGYLGTGDTTNRTIFERNAYFYNNDIKIIDIAKNDGYGTSEGNYCTTHFLTSAGNVYSTGENNWGAIGNGGTTDTTTPIKAIGLGPPDTDPVVKIFSGGYGSTVFAVTDKGDTYAWGYNAYGTIGNASSTNQTSPQLISPTYIPKGVVDVKTWQGYDINSSGTEVTNWYTASMALLSSGEMYFTGNSKYGIAGDNAATNNYTLWHQISAKTTMDKLAASGGVYSDISDISLLTNVKQFDVTAGTIYPTVVAVTYDGQAYTWGYGGYGQLCMTDVTGTTLDSFIPVNITQSLLSSLDSSDIRNKVSKVLCARHAPRYSGQISWGTTYFQDTDGQLYGCGNNEHGYIPGQGTTTATGGKLAKIPLPCLPSEVADWKVIQISDAPAQGNSDQYRASNLLIITTDGRVYIAGSGNGAAAFGDGGINTDASYGNRRSYWVQVAF